MIFDPIFTILCLGGIIGMIFMAKTDLKRRIIPDAILVPWALVGLCLVTFWGWPVSIADGTIGAVVGYILGAGIGGIFAYLRRNRGDTYAPIGMGDIKLMAAGGIWLGAAGLSIAVVAACVMGGIWGIYHRARYIPFAPFFFGGAIIALLALQFLL